MTVRWVAALPGAAVVGLRWANSLKEYESKEFGSVEEALAYGGGSVVEVVTVRNPDGKEFTFEGRILADPSDRLHVGATVERVWYTIPGLDAEYDDFYAARRDVEARADPPSYVLEHLRLRQPDGRPVEQDGRILNLDPTWSPVSRRYANAYRRKR